MAKYVILFADNDPDFLDARSEFLVQKGYTIIPATSFEDARSKLDSNHIDLAIIDIRLTNDDDEKDISGLDLARDVARTVPKIILTGFPNVSYVREMLKPQTDGLPTAVGFVAKQEGPDSLLREIKNAITREGFPPANEIARRLEPVSFDISNQLLKDYEEVRMRAAVTYKARLYCIVIGALVILIGSIAALIGQITAGALSTISGIIAQGLAALFGKFEKDAYCRMDQYHRELVIFYRKEKDR